MNSKKLRQVASVAAGALVAAAGVRKGGRPGVLLSLAGGALGIMGYIGFGRRRSLIADPQRKYWQLPSDRLREDADAFGRAGRGGADVVHEASDESFPASDAPSFTPNTSIGKHEST